MSYKILMIATLASLLLSSNRCVPPPPKEKQCLNVTVLLDLSDRLIKNTNQTSNDTALISHIAKAFNDSCFEKNVKFTRNRFKIYFYPTPTDPTIDGISKNLEVDYSQMKQADKLQKSADFMKSLAPGISTIYSSTLKTKNWIGCDIWGFFDSKVKNQCIRPDEQKAKVKFHYRNILVVLTDGYIYHNDNLSQEGDQYTYITPTTLATGGKLKAISDKLDNLEVLFLEVNPQPISDFNKMKTTIGNWLEGMGVKHWDVVQTDVTSNTEVAIDNFLKANN